MGCPPFFFNDQCNFQTKGDGLLIGIHTDEKSNNQIMLA